LKSNLCSALFIYKAIALFITKNELNKVFSH
jgi:hypothetical protein